MTQKCVPRLRKLSSRCHQATRQTRDVQRAVSAICDSLRPEHPLFAITRTVRSKCESSTVPLTGKKAESQRAEVTT